MPCRDHNWFYLSACPKCSKGGIIGKSEQIINESDNKPSDQGLFTDKIIDDIMNDLTEVPVANRPVSNRDGNKELTKYEFTHRILVEGNDYILTEAMNNQPRARWLTKSRKQAEELLSKRKQLLEDIVGEIYAAEAVRMVVQ